MKSKTKEKNQTYKFSFILLALPLSILLTSLFASESFAFRGRSLEQHRAKVPSLRGEGQRDVIVTRLAFTATALRIANLFTPEEIPTVNGLLNILKESTEINGLEASSVNREDFVKVVEVTSNSTRLSSSDGVTSVTDVLGQLKSQVESPAANDNNRFNSLSNEVKVIIGKIAYQVRTLLIPSFAQMVNSVNHSKEILNGEIEDVGGLQVAMQTDRLVKMSAKIDNAIKNVRTLTHVFKVIAEAYNGNLAGGVNAHNKLLEIVEAITNSSDLILTSRDISNIIKDIKKVHPNIVEQITKCVA